VIMQGLGQDAMVHQEPAQLTVEGCRQNEGASLARTFEEEVTAGGAVGLSQESGPAIRPCRNRGARIANAAALSQDAHGPVQLVGMPGVVLIGERHELEA